MRWIAWGKKTVPVPGRSGAQSSVASTRWEQFKEGVRWMWGVQRDFASHFAHSGWVQFLGSGKGCTNDSLSSPDYPSLSSVVRFGSLAEPDSYWSAEDEFNNGRVERFQQLLWQVELPQLAKEVEPLLGLFYNGVYVIVPFQVLGDDLNDSTAVTVLFMMVSGGRARGFLLKSTIISTLLSVFSSRLLRLHQTASSLTSCQ